MTDDDIEALNLLRDGALLAGPAGSHYYSHGEWQEKALAFVKRLAAESNPMTSDTPRDAAFICERNGRWFLNIEGRDEATEIGPTDDELYVMHEAVNGEEARSAEGRRRIARQMRAALRSETCQHDGIEDASDCPRAGA